MSWDDNKSPGDLISSSDYNDGVTDQKTRIKGDGTTTTTEIIPFTEGARIQNDKKLFFGDGTNNYMIYVSATNKFQIYFSNTLVQEWGA